METTIWIIIDVVTVVMLLGGILLTSLGGSEKIKKIGNRMIIIATIIAVIMAVYFLYILFITPP